MSFPPNWHFFHVLCEWIHEHTKQTLEYKNSILYTCHKHSLPYVKLVLGMLDCKDYEFHFMQIKLILINMCSTHYNCACSILSNIPSVSHCHRRMGMKGGNSHNMQYRQKAQQNCPKYFLLFPYSEII